MLDRNEKQKEFPSLIGLENIYNQVKVAFDPNFDRRLVNLAQVVGLGAQSENSGDFTTVSQSFLPQLSFTNEEDGGASVQPIPPLNISNISFNEPSSPINDRTSSTKTGDQTSVKKELPVKEEQKSTGNSLEDSGNSSFNQVSQSVMEANPSKLPQGSLRRVSMLKPATQLEPLTDK